jgi:NadR type nicotinamide-nucleotide adenylyltransferase
MSAETLRVAVFGPESTGKSQLAAKLAAHFGVPLVAEYAREFWDQHGAIALGDIEAIAREQWRREDAAAASGAPLIVCDTEALTTVLWSDLLYGTTPDRVRREAEKRCRNYALYLLLDTDVPFAPDPQRCFPEAEERERCRRVWQGALDRRSLPYVWIRGEWAAREQAAIAAITPLLVR